MFPDRFLKKLRHCYLENSEVLFDLSDCLTNANRTLSAQQPWKEKN